MFIPDPGSDFFPSRIPDPNCLHPGFRILIKEFKYFNPQKAKKWFLSSKKYDPGCSSRIPDPDADFLPSRIPDPGSRGQKGTQSRIPDPGSGSATLIRMNGIDTYLWIHLFLLEGRRHLLHTPHGLAVQ